MEKNRLDDDRIQFCSLSQINLRSIEIKRTATWNAHMPFLSFECLSALEVSSLTSLRNYFGYLLFFASVVFVSNAMGVIYIH